ncbi:hypothetical protein B1A99_08590 [Cohnella sp. CIP 111063]|uniref:DUF1304 domain-containing protein n=1 Tax=unclassified Cohnella TaxID=2636738 RepID=UPI000B8C4CFE|nr:MULTISPECIES: DUF1304 domain-containing protein [unclassified Cohnella]OXS60470.1 hypothetical protein B1A99_08590 [Cohnella sp. CIP 111063]PRX73176.1 putative membrane protein [Cohnella sp. SGD-V74]
MIVAAVLVGLVALAHVILLLTETLLWTSPGNRQSRGMTSGFARDSKPLAASSGLHNGFLAAGLVWGLVYPSASVGYQIQTFFLVCALIAAIYGIWNGRRSFDYIRGAAAAAAWIAVLSVW